MSELILFTLNAIVVYIFADWLLRMIEKRRGAVLKQRWLVFFVIFLVLIMTTSTVIQNFVAPL